MTEGLNSFLGLIDSPITLLVISLVGVFLIIFSIVLCFKLWGMANNVEKMTKIMESNQVQSDELWTD